MFDRRWFIRRGADRRSRIGGDSFISSAQNFVSFGIPLWQVLCLVATLSSVTAVIANGMLKANNLTSKIADARSCDAKLEGIETMLELEQISLQQATQEYMRSLTQIPHIRGAAVAHE